VPHPLDSCRLKIHRAQEHLHALDAEIRAFIDRRPYGIVGHFNPQKSRYIFVVRVFEEPPARFGLLIGDVLHNAASALDHLAWALVCHAHSTPIEGQTGFPVFADRKKWNGPRGGEWMMEGMFDTHRAEIERLQPYHKGIQGRIDPLYLLKVLWNVDKHRVLHTTAATAVAAGANFVPERGVKQIVDTGINIGTYIEDAEVGWAEIVLEGEDPPKVYMESSTSLDVAFSESGTAKGRITGFYVSSTLGDMLKEVQRVYELFLLDFD
jgi:hypothetical protein